MRKNLIILSIFVLISLLAMFIGYRLGKSRVKVVEKEIEKIVYQQGETIHDTLPITQLKPYEVIVHDTVEIPADTAALFAAWLDYNKERMYNLDFSNDTLGRFEVDVTVNRNQLTQATSRITPIQKVITKKEVIYDVPKFQFYGMIGSDVMLTSNKVEFGVDYKQKYLLSVAGIRHQQDYFYTINFGLKF